MKLGYKDYHPDTGIVISSKMTWFLKYFFPAMPILWLALFVLIPANVPAAEQNPTPPFFFLPIIFIALVWFFIWKNLIWDLADRVTDYGAYLLVKKKGIEIRVDLANIMNVNSVTFMNPPRITLRLIEPSTMGQEIVFSPIRKSMWRGPFANFAKNPIAGKS